MLESCKFGDLALLKYWYEGQRRLSTSLSRDGTCLALLYGRHTVVNWFLEGPTFPHDDPHLLTHAVIGGDATLIDLLLAKGGRVHPLALKAASLRLSPSLIRSLESHLDPKTILDVDNLPEVNKIALLYGARPGLARFIVSLSEANLLTEPMLDLPFILRFLLEEGSILFNFEATETAILDNRWELVKVICKVQRLPPWSEASSTIGQNVWYRDRVQSLHGVIANALTSTSDINAMHLRYFLDRDFVEISQLHLNSILKSPIAESNWELVRAILDSTKLRNKLQILISDAPTPIFERVFWEYQEQIIPLITGRLLFLFPKERLEWALFGAKIIPITPRLAVDLFLGGLFDVVSKIVPSMVSSIAIPIASVFDRSSNRGDDLFKHFLEMFPRGWATLLHSDADVAQFVSEYDDLLQLVQIGCVQWSMSLESAIISRGNIPLLIRLLLLQNEDTIPLPLHPEIIPPLVEIVYRFDWNAAISSRFGINFSLSDTLESARNRRWGLVNLGLHKHDQLLTLELRQELVMEAMRGNAPIFFRDDKSSELHDLLMTFDFATLREFVEDSWYSNLSIHVLVFAFMRGLELDVERVVRKICSGNGGAIFSYSHSDMKAWDEIFQFHDVDLTVFYDCKTAPMDPLKAQSYSGHITLDAQAADFFVCAPPSFKSPLSLSFSFLFSFSSLMPGFPFIKNRSYLFIAPASQSVVQKVWKTTGGKKEECYQFRLRQCRSGKPYPLRGGHSSTLFFLFLYLLSCSEFIDANSDHGDKFHPFLFN